MKILLVTTTFFPRFGGVEQFLAQLFGDHQKFEVDVLTEPTESPVGGWKIIRQPLLSHRFFRPRWLQTVWSIPKLVKKGGYEIIVLGHYAPYLSSALRCQRRFGTKVVVIAHGLDVLSYETAGGFRRRLLKCNLPKADLVIVNSKYTETVVASLGVAQSRRVVLTPGVEIPTILKSKQECRQILKLPADVRVALTIGRLVPRKGHKVALKAIQKLQSEMPNLHYLIVGQGSEEKTLHEFVKNVGISDRVHFYNHVQDTGIAYGASDIFVFPSTAGVRGDVEGFGMVSIEAQSYGLPVVASSVGGVPGTFQHGITGLLVPPNDPASIADAVKSIMQNPARLSEMSLAAKEFVKKNFSLQDRREKLLQYLRIILEIPNEKVSVIVPAYNSASTVEKTLRGLLKQTLRPAEIIVVDDGSTDSTGELVKNFKVKLIRQNNLGASAARNVGLAEATSPLILFCDSDVNPKPNMLEALTRALLLRPDAGYAYCNFRFGWHTFDLFDFDAQRLQSENYISTMSLLRRENCIGFNGSLKRYQDWDLWKRLLERNVKGVWVPRRLFKTRLGQGISKDSISSLRKLAIKKLIKH
jgi:phosphatidylinositol alpha-1,6-mannosyltransferase